MTWDAMRLVFYRAPSMGIHAGEFVGDAKGGDYAAWSSPTIGRCFRPET